MITIEEYLQVLPNYTFPDRIIQRALGYYNLEAGTPAYDIPERERDLAEAMMWDAASGIVNGGAYKKQIGNRSITTASLQTSQQDRMAWSQKAKDLRNKWGEESAVGGETLEIIDYTEMW